MKNVLFFLFFSLGALRLGAQAPDPVQVKALMKRVADWQIMHYGESYSYRTPHHPLDWTNGALYAGMAKWAAMAGEDTYYTWLKKVGEEHGWSLHSRRYHADDHTVGQMYLDLYRTYGDKKMLEPTKKSLDYLIYHPARTALTWESPFHQDRWNWCDALFMSPPVWAKLYQISGEKKYLDFMMREFRATTDFLFDKKEHLYYRDQSYMGKLDHGTKIFWARGNGWVFAGLVLVMNELTPGTKEYGYFLSIYQKMARKLLDLQTPQGHWAMSLLGQAYYPTPETSGTSFFTYGLAWGINRGILNRDTYEPAVRKAWNALAGYVTDAGMLGYVQPIGAGPGDAWPDKTEVYGTGAFLCAGSEVFKLYSR